MRPSIPYVVAVLLRFLLAQVHLLLFVVAIFRLLLLDTTGLPVEVIIVFLHGVRGVEGVVGGVWVVQMLELERVKSTRSRLANRMHRHMYQPHSFTSPNLATSTLVIPSHLDMAR